MGRRRRRPLIDGWVCPRCGANGIRHGRGGAIACKTDNTSPHCRGLECGCEDGTCYSKHPEGFGWRRSPCKRAKCYHCGWEGELRSREFERAFGNARCHRSGSGWHFPIIRVRPNTEPGSLVLYLTCTICGMEGVASLDPIDDIRWWLPSTEDQSGSAWPPEPARQQGVLERIRRGPLTDGWVCPRCGATGIRHGRGGARACKTNNTSPHCRGLECECEDGRCYSKHPEGFGWRRSPCKTARCYHCGWEGEIRSREFERAFGNARCPKSTNGWHTPVIRVQPNSEPSSLVLHFTCTICAMEGIAVLDPIDDIRWYQPGEVEGK